LARIFCILFGNWKLEIENCENFLKNFRALVFHTWQSFFAWKNESSERRENFFDKNFAGKFQTVEEIKRILKIKNKKNGNQEKSRAEEEGSREKEARGKEKEEVVFALREENKKSFN